MSNVSTARAGSRSTFTLRPDEQLRHVITAATLAPSVHNTQPWRFVERPGGVDLFADDRRLAVLDPLGRLVRLSCGAALLHARVAARGLGLDVTVALQPEPATPALLARLQLSPGIPATEAEIDLATAILHRHTFRGVLEDRPVPETLVEELRRVTEAEGAILRPVTRPDDLIELRVLLASATTEELSDQAYRVELPSWVGRDPAAGDGVAESALVVLLSTMGDDVGAWLQAGEAMGAVLLHAAGSGLLAQPLGQVTDQPGSRVRLARALSLVGVPQLVLRMGFAPGRAGTPRRPVDELLAGSSRSGGLS